MYPSPNAYPWTLLALHWITCRSLLPSAQSLQTSDRISSVASFTKRIRSGMLCAATPFLLSKQYNLTGANFTVKKHTKNIWTKMKLNEINWNQKYIFHLISFHFGALSLAAAQALQVELKTDVERWCNSKQCYFCSLHYGHCLSYEQYEFVFMAVL